MESFGENNEDLREEEGEVVEAVLPAHHGTHHEEPGAREQDEREQHDDLGVGRGWGVWGEGELEGGRGGEGRGEMRSWDLMECLFFLETGDGCHLRNDGELCLFIVAMKE